MYRGNIQSVKIIDLLNDSINDLRKERQPGIHFEYIVSQTLSHPFTLRSNSV
jgi:hypothetical protein